MTDKTTKLQEAIKRNQAMKKEYGVKTIEPKPKPKPKTTLTTVMNKLMKYLYSREKPKISLPSHVRSKVDIKAIKETLGKE